MATLVLATGTGAADSADITLASGETSTLVIRDAAGRVALPVYQKDENNAYTQIGELNERSYVLTGPGTFRVSRPAGGKSCGVFRG